MSPSWGATYHPPNKLPPPRCTHQAPPARPPQPCHNRRATLPPHPLCAPRCRILYEKYLEWGPSNAAAWLRYAEFEAALGEAGRARALYELAISQPLLDMPEALWKGYIDFEISQVRRPTPQGVVVLVKRARRRVRECMPAIAWVS